MFPNRVYLKFEPDGEGGEFLTVEVDAEEFADLDEDVKVGVYELVGTATVRTVAMVVE